MRLGEPQSHYEGGGEKERERNIISLLKKSN
jgi:hypothetical protein